MADSKITALTAITTVNPATYPLVIVDTSDTSMAITGTTKKVTTNQLLGSGGTATLASATITGDLTVDTSTLKVDSANDRVGVGITSPLAKLDVRQIAAAEGLKVYVNDTGATNIINFRSYDNTLGEVTRYAVACNGVATWSNVGGVAGTAMTLNSTGLLVGTNTLKVDSANNRVGIGTASPGAIFDIYQATLGTAYFRGGYAARQMSITATSDGSNDGAIHTFSIGSSAGQFAFANSSGTRMTLDSSGNLGLGVTPSAWSAFKAIDIGTGSSISGASTTTALGFNNYWNGSNYIYKLTAAAGDYRQTASGHAWFTAPSGTAGNAITWTQAMTLDASGYLLIGTTDTAFTSGAGYKFGPGATPSSGQVGASSSNGDLTYRLYSTGAAAYRFYVGFGGTVFATNTTISAISDARLKENVQDIDVGLGAILALKPRKFDWKAGKGKDIKGDRGFIAQEFEQVFPQLVDQWADEAPEGEAPYKSVRQDLIPVLVKAIQELTARVQTLETR